MKRVLVTGALGFAGRHLIEYLKRQPPRGEILLTDRLSPKADTPLPFQTLDLMNASDALKVIKDFEPDAVLHLAGLTVGGQTSDFWTTNVGGTAQLCQALILASSSKKLPRLLSLGSAAEYAPSEKAVDETMPCHPLSHYGLSKLAQTQVALAYGRESGLPVMVARAFNLIGAGMPESLVAGTIARQIHRQLMEKRNSIELEIGDLHPVRDFIDMRDAIRAYWNILEHGQPGEIYNVCSGVGVSIRELLDQFQKVSKTPIEVKQSTERLRPTQIPYSVGCPTKLAKLADWKPEITLESSLRALLESLALA